MDHPIHNRAAADTLSESMRLWGNSISRWLGIVLLMLLGSITPAVAHTYIQVGVDSNFVVHEDKVYFSQSDGSLTVLKVQSGGVLARKTDFDYSGTLRLVDAGLLVMNYDQITLLNLTTLAPIWRVADRLAQEMEGTRLIDYDGNGLVECRELATGKVLWTYNLPGALDIVVENGRVFVFRSAVWGRSIFQSAIHDEADGVPAVVLLDLATGHEIFHKTTPPGWHYLNAYFDGQKIYLAAGSYKGEYKNQSPMPAEEQGRPSAKFEKLLVWGLDGAELESLPVPEGSAREPISLNGDEAYLFAGKVFEFHRAWNSVEAVAPWRAGRGKTADGLKSFEVFGGTLKVTDYKGRFFYPEDKSEMLVSMESDVGNWKGHLPYLEHAGSGGGNDAAIVAVGSTKDLVLLGSSLGHVECLDAATGRSLWMYVFPTIQQTMSYASPNGMPPTMASAAATYRRENKNRSIESGLMLEGATAPSHPKIMLDPSPADPFKNLSRYLAIAWSGAVLPPILMGLTLLAYRQKNWNVRIPPFVGLLLAAVATAGYIYYGRVSLGSSLGLRAGMLVALVTTFVFSIGCFRARYRWYGSLFLLLSAGLLFFIHPVFLHV